MRPDGKRKVRSHVGSVTLPKVGGMSTVSALEMFISLNCIANIIMQFFTGRLYLKSTTLTSIVYSLIHE